MQQKKQKEEMRPFGTKSKTADDKEAC